MDIGPDLSSEQLNEYMNLWDRVTSTALRPDEPDRTTWSLEANGDYSTKSAYEAQFVGREVEPAAEFTWRSKAPLRCRFFLWLGMRNKCWTSDRLARRGLDHQDACPFRDQHEETLDHLLLGCVFAREVWRVICGALGRPQWALNPDSRLRDWGAVTATLGPATKDARALLLLVLWEIWKHRNAIVFDDASLSSKTLVSRIDTEGRAWKQAGIFKGSVEPLLEGLVRWAKGRS